MSVFGKLFKEARLKAKVTQRHIATAMGLTPSAISQWETGDTVPDSERLHHLSRMLDLDQETMAAAIAEDASESVKSPYPAQSKAAKTPPPMPPFSFFQRGEGMPLYATNPLEDGNGFEITKQIVDIVHRPPRLLGREDVFALFMRGGEMAPWREPGELVVIDYNRPPRVGDYVLVTLKELADGRRRSFIRRLSEGRLFDVRLEQYNPEKEDLIKLDAIEEMLRIADWTELMLGG